jgi:hypothetical protein
MQPASEKVVAPPMQWPSGSAMQPASEGVDAPVTHSPCGSMTQPFFGWLISFGAAVLAPQPVARSHQPKSQSATGPLRAGIPPTTTTPVPRGAAPAGAASSITRATRATTRREEDDRATRWSLPGSPPGRPAMVGTGGSPPKNAPKSYLWVGFRAKFVAGEGGGGRCGAGVAGRRGEGVASSLGRSRAGSGPAPRFRRH